MIRFNYKWGCLNYDSEKIRNADLIWFLNRQSRKMYNTFAIARGKIRKP